jgi:signal transduction histidine kinase
MQTLIKDLLVFSSINEKASLFDQTDLTEIVQDCVQELTDQIQEKKAIIEVEDLPVVLGVPFQLRQLVINILDNALKYTREGIRPKIKITSKILDKGDPVLSKLPNSHDQYLKISFSDNGIGLDKNYAESIFNPFKRLHMKDEYPGSGIGLAICKKIVETHQGLITADGRKGFGSTFRVYLPILSEATFSCR